MKLVVAIAVAFLASAVAQKTSSNRALTAFDRGDECPFGLPEVTVDFADFAPREYVSSVPGIFSKIIAIAATEEGFTPNEDGVHDPDGGAARVLDSANPDDDKDLGSPNKACGGPGVGDGGRPGEPGENCVPQGNVLIIQETDKATSDDAAEGGSLVFQVEPSFSATLKSVGVLDVDEHNVTIVGMAKGGSVMSTAFAGLGENAFQEIFVDDLTDPVEEFQVNFFGSGAVSYLKLCEAPNPCVKVDQSIQVVTGGPFDDADSQPGPGVCRGSTVKYKYTVTNCGNSKLCDVKVAAWDPYGVFAYEPHYVAGDDNNNNCLDVGETLIYKKIRYVSQSERRGRNKAVAGVGAVGVNGKWVGDNDETYSYVYRNCPH